VATGYLTQRDLHGRADDRAAGLEVNIAVGDMHMSGDDDKQPPPRAQQTTQSASCSSKRELSGVGRRPLT